MKTILLVDDEPKVLELLTAMLEDGQHRLLLASNGEEALDIARSERPDVVFLDINMPVKDGFEVCSAIKEDPITAHAKVVMLTALSQTATRQRANEAGADDFLSKPFSLRALLDKLREVLEPN